MKFRDLLKSNKLVIFDGAMGTLLQQENLPATLCPETYNITQPQIIKNIHQRYIGAGSQIITTNTFGANRKKLAVYNLENQIEKINAAAVKLAKSVAKPKGVFVAGDMSILGEMVEPLGKVGFDEAVTVFEEQALLLKKYGCDCLIIETVTDIQEMRAALVGAQSAKIPVIATMTFEKDMRTVMGTDPMTAAIVMQGLGADVIGANCSTGPKELVEVARLMVTVAKVPVLIQPNAGMPKLVDAKTVFPLGAEEFSSYATDFAALGVKCLGGCCGTTPEHIKRLTDNSKRITVKTRAKNTKTYLTSRAKTVEVGEYPVIIGERLNPTARKTLAEAVRNKKYTLFLEEARNQVQAGCDLLDLNVSVPGTQETETIKRLILDISNLTNTPLVIDSPNNEVLAEGLKHFPGKALVNSVTGEKKKMTKVLPIVKKYGGAVIGLCIDEKGIPKTWQQRVGIAGKIIKEADKYGISRKDIFIDCLALALSAEPGGLGETLKAITAVKERYGVRTVLGVSNVSHGLPNRSLINSHFLSMAVAAGLDAVIVNPLDEKMQEALLASAYLAGRDKNGRKYLSRFVPQQTTITTKTPAGVPADLKDSIISGDRDSVLELTLAKVKQDKPLDIVNNDVIPGLEEVGRRFEAKECFLPQLMLSAEAAQIAMGRLRQELEKDKTAAGQEQGIIVFATVQGDVHDIGKNIVIAILQNYGYKIIDLGKDVSAEKIVAATRKYQADMVALSALMTTTVVEMPKVIEALRKAGLKTKVIVGGAVVTPEYAKDIGADGYGKDAVEAARVIKNLIADRAGSV